MTKILSLPNAPSRFGRGLTGPVRRGNPLRSGPVPVGGPVKRAFDVTAVLLGLLALAPLFIGVALIIRFSSAGPVFYGHNRVGFDGRIFRCWKFRSMVVDGDEVLARHLRDDDAARAEWLETQKLRDDPRITPIGRVIRKLSIDELPQLVNVLVGDMSLVGPRPVVTEELNRYGMSRRHYLRTRPGLTGLWQVSGRSDIDYGRRVALDRSYVSRWTLAQDVSIIARTFPAVARSRGSY